MTTETLIPIKKVALKNNCPECFRADGLQLTFKQKHTETKFYTSISKDISHDIYCETCKSTIYPERWTDDIERVFEYQKKAFVPKPTSKSFKKLFWVLVVIVAIVIASVVSFVSVYFANA